MHTIQIQFDGGCKPNPGMKYGSYEVRVNGRPRHSESRFELGFGTNNEAEFESLLRALTWTITTMADKQVDPANFEVSMLTDSRIVANRVIGRNNRRKKEPEKRMAALADKIKTVLAMFHSYTIRWHGRENNVQLFGH